MTFEKRIIGNATLWLGDCLERTAEIPDGSVDMVLCDLPYGTTAAAWDVVIPFADLWAHYKRLVKPKGAIVLTAAQPFTTEVIASNRAMFKYCWYWEKSQGSNFFLASYQPLKVVEDIVVFSASAASFNKAGNCMIYNPQMTKLDKPYTRDCSKNTNGPPETSPRVCRQTAPVMEKTHATPRSLLYVKPDQHRGLHPTQKPVALLEYLVRTYSNAGDTVLDNCMGSASTGVACANTGRQFIGIEKEQRFFDIACKRLTEAQQQMGLLLEAA